ncbi:MAG: GH3 auxin-responsive promoter [Verrucomicrobia bacterium]|nr:MAG: GH3 auxin-responsive promoter [Verrucomicrobiota bacterium]
MRLSPAFANAAWVASSLPAWLRFKRAASRPDIAQRCCMLRAVGRNANTAYGRLHRFGEVRNYADFARNVPLARYEDLEPWIKRIVAGEPNVLTSEPVTRLVPTSGTSSGRKLIPFTASLQREFDSAISPWIFDLYCNHPGATLGTAYWSITPAAVFEEDQNSAVPIGFDEDAGYLGGVKKNLLARVIMPPAEFRLIPDTAVFRYLTLLCLLRQADLSLISVWHPSFLLLLLGELPLQWENLLRDVRDGTCKYDHELPDSVRRAAGSNPEPQRARHLARAGFGQPGVIWPKLRVISCWGDAHAEGPLNQLHQRLPGIFIQPKGLLATEAFVTFPLGDLHPLAVRSHFYEFEHDFGRILLAHELSEGSEYEVIVTTGGGLYRYRLGDRVRVTGYLQNTPCLRFLGRNGMVSDRFGEKLSEAFVAAAIRSASSSLSETPKFALLAPEQCAQGMRYALFIEATVDSGFSRRLDLALRENPHYLYCRKIGQLSSPDVVEIPDRAYERYLAREMEKGKRVGEIKPCALSTDTGWRQHLCQASG